MTPGQAHAGWAVRAAAFGIDVLFGLGLACCLLLVGWSAPVGGAMWWACVVLAAAVLLAVAVNRWLLPVTTGWSLGRSVFGIAVLDRECRRPGPWVLLLRDLAHLLDTVPLLLGWLWPLLDRRGRTFADLLLRTTVAQVGAPAMERRRLAGSLITGVALMALLVAGLGYLTVYRQQQLTAQTREQIAIEGPKIVAEMLSYTVKNVDDDFARAQRLATEEYRPEIATQQASVREVGLVDNDYWVTDGAVLSADPGRATMLLLMQGQRGAAPKQRFITASVRASFVKDRSGQWQVSDLTVLKPGR